MGHFSLQRVLVSRGEYAPRHEGRNGRQLSRGKRPVQREGWARHQQSGPRRRRYGGEGGGKDAEESRTGRKSSRSHKFIEKAQPGGIESAFRSVFSSECNRGRRLGTIDTRTVPVEDGVCLRDRRCCCPRKASSP